MVRKHINVTTLFLCDKIHLLQSSEVNWKSKSLECAYTLYQNKIVIPDKELIKSTEVSKVYHKVVTFSTHVSKTI